MTRVATYPMAFDKESEFLVADWPLEITEPQLREIFGVRPEQDWVGDFEVAEAQREALQRFTSHRIDLEARDYFVGDRDVEY